MGEKKPHRHNSDMTHRKGPKSSELKDLVAQRFKAAGEAYTSNQAQLARDLGVDPRQLNGYYRGRNYPDEAMLVKFCNLSGCTMDWIYRGIMDTKLPPETAVHIALRYPELVRQQEAVAVVAAVPETAV